MATCNDRLTELTLEAQADMFRLAERDHGLCTKAISSKSNIPYNTLRSYKGSGCEPVVMPVTAVNKLVGIIPDYLLSYVFNATGRCIVPQQPDEGDHDTFAGNCIDIAAATARARHPGSPGGVEIVDCEDRELRARRENLRRRA